MFLSDTSGNCVASNGGCEAQPVRKPGKQKGICTAESQAGQKRVFTGVSGVVDSLAHPGWLCVIYRTRKSEANPVCFQLQTAQTLPVSTEQRMSSALWSCLVTYQNSTNSTLQGNIMLQ
jgi:hypothetical protein